MRGSRSIERRAGDAGDGVRVELAAVSLARGGGGGSGVAGGAGDPVSSPARIRRRTVAGRLLGSYLVVLLAFAVTMGWSLRALRAAARDAELLRAGYVPLLLRVGEALAEQNVFNAQLNHITAAKNSGDVREWIETARRTRPLTFALVREAAERGLDAETEPSVRRFREEIAREAGAIERSLGSDPERFAQLFQSLAVGDREGRRRCGASSSSARPRGRSGSAPSGRASRTRWPTSPPTRVVARRGRCSS